MFSGTIHNFTWFPSLDSGQFTMTATFNAASKTHHIIHYMFDVVSSFWPNHTAHLRAADADKWTWPTEELGWYTR